MYVGVLPAYMNAACVPGVHWRTEESVGSSGTGIYRWLCILNRGPLLEPSLEPHEVTF